MHVRSLLSRVGLVGVVFSLVLAVYPTHASADSSAEDAKALISKFKELCESNPGHARCIGVEVTCKATAPSCELIQAAVCSGMTGGACSATYLCSTESVAQLCEEPPSEGANYFAGTMDYTQLGEDIGDWALTFRLTGLGKSGSGKFGWAFGYDFGAGLYRGGGDSGFAYELQYMFGGAARIGKTGMVGVLGGVGLSGMAVGHIGFGFPLSLQAFYVAPLTKSLDLEVFVRPSWIYSESAREDGTDIFVISDEVNAQVGLTWGDRTDKKGVSYIEGYKFLAFFKEQLGAQMVGLGFGFAFGEVVE